MAAKKVGRLIKEARTNAGFTQEQLARKVKGLSTSDISKAERGEKELTQEQLKAIAKATGVTQKSLLEAAKGSSSSGSSSASKTSMRLTASEKKLVELYRKADSQTKKAAVDLLKKGTAAGGVISELTGSAGSGSGGVLGSFINGVLGKRETPQDDSEETGLDE